MKHLYEVNVGGGPYWVAADTIHQAVDALFQYWKDEGWDADAELKGFEIDEVSEKRAKKLHITETEHQRLDGLDIRTPMAMDEATAAATKSTVIACSEWP